MHTGKNIAEKFNPLSRVHERYRPKTDMTDRRICDSKDPNVTYSRSVRVKGAHVYLFTLAPWRRTTRPANFEKVKVVVVARVM